MGLSNSITVSLFGLFIQRAELPETEREKLVFFEEEGYGYTEVVLVVVKSPGPATVEY